MTYRETEAWLNRAKNLKHEIRMLNKRIEEANDRATSITSSPDAIVVQGSKDPHKFDYVAELTSSLLDHKRKLDSMLAEIQRTINTLEDSKQRVVLSRYYIDSVRVNTIALEMNDCTVQYIYKIKRQGIKNLKNLEQFK